MDYFVSYSWINGKPDPNVLRMVDRLRLLGYDIECDIMTMQSQTSTDLFKMMAENLSSAKKVIVVLSEQYKEKAGLFQSGSGKEYRYILEDINSYKDKYILVSFVPLTNENKRIITPPFLEGREIIDLSNGIDEDSTLLYRLSGIAQYEFKPVENNAVFPEPDVVTPCKKKDVKSFSDKITIVSTKQNSYTQSNLFHINTIIVQYTPIIASWNYNEDEYYVGDIKIETNNAQYIPPREIFNAFINDSSIDNKNEIMNNTFETKVRVDDYSVKIVGGQRPHQLLFYMSPALYRDYLMVREVLDKHIKNSETIRSKYFCDSQALITRELPNICGVGVFIITSDNMVLVSKSSRNVSVNPNKYIYSASGTMDWHGANTNPFDDIIRETHEEIGYDLDIENTKMYSFGMDNATGYYQFSFYEQSSLTAEEILSNTSMARDFQIEIQNTIAIKFDCKSVIDFISNNDWDETAKANLITLIAKFEGKAAIEEYISPGKRIKRYKSRMKREWDRRSEREGVFAVLSSRYPASDINRISNTYYSHVVDFIDEDLSQSRVLEIGGGIGLFTKYFASNALSLTCIDVSNGMIRRNKEYLGEILAKKVRYVNSFFQEYDEDAFYDIIICSLVLIHNADDLQNMIDTMKRYSDTIYLFEHIESGAQVSIYTEPKPTEEYLMYFPEYYVEKQDYHVLCMDNIVFLKLVRKLSRN